jgi:hypothetical protein
MLDELSKLFKEGLQYTHVAGILQQVANLTNIVSAQYMKDGSGKNAAIDLLCNILQSHKDVPVVVAPVVAEAVENATS